MVMEVSGKRRRGRPKRRWLDNIKYDLSEREFVRGRSLRPSSMEASHKTHRPHIKVGKDAEEEDWCRKGKYSTALHIFYLRANLMDYTNLSSGVTALNSNEMLTAYIAHKYN